jgi:hypothetical protein
MIMHGTTPRALTGAGLLVVLGLGSFLLPLRPTWAQVEEPREGLAAQAEREDQALLRQNAVREFQAQREKLHAERQKLQEEMERSRAQFEKAMHKFEVGIAQLQEREQNTIRQMERQGRAERQQAEAFPVPTPRPRSPGRERASDTESRLAELERKLDALLTEVQSLRREMRRSGTPRNPGMPTPALPPRPGDRGAPWDGEDPRPHSPRPAVAPVAVPPGAALPPTPARPFAPGASPVAPTPAALPATRPAPPASPDSDPEPPLPEVTPRP